MKLAGITSVVMSATITRIGGRRQAKASAAAKDNAKATVMVVGLTW